METEVDADRTEHDYRHPYDTTLVETMAVAFDADPDEVHEFLGTIDAHLAEIITQDHRDDDDRVFRVINHKYASGWLVSGVELLPDTVIVYDYDAFNTDSVPVGDHWRDHIELDIPLPDYKVYFGAVGVLYEVKKAIDHDAVLPLIVVSEYDTAD